MDKGEFANLQQQLEAKVREREEDAEVIAELRAEVSGLLEELRSLNARFEDAQLDREQEAGNQRDLQSQLETMTRKYEQAKTDLRATKGASSVLRPLLSLT